MSKEKEGSERGATAIAWKGYFDVAPVLPGEKLRGVKGGRREIPHATPATTFPLAWPCSR